MIDYAQSSNLRDATHRTQSWIEVFQALDQTRLYEPSGALRITPLSVKAVYEDAKTNPKNRAIEGFSSVKNFSKYLEMARNICPKVHLAHPSYSSH